MRILVVASSMMIEITLWRIDRFFHMEFYACNFSKIDRNIGIWSINFLFWCNYHAICLFSLILVANHATKKRNLENAHDRQASLGKARWVRVKRYVANVLTPYSSNNL